MHCIIVLHAPESPAAMQHNIRIVWGAGDWAEGNMWSCSTFAEHLDASCAQPGLWENHIQPQMQRIVQYSLACATVSDICVFTLPLLVCCVSSNMHLACAEMQCCITHQYVLACATVSNIFVSPLYLPGCIASYLPLSCIQV